MVGEQFVTSEGASHAREEPDRETSDGNEPLLSDLEANHRTYHMNGDPQPEAAGKRSARGAVKDFTIQIARKSAPVATDALRSIPAAILDALLNILDGISYGMIISPLLAFSSTLAASACR
ncbi:hypothetical protein BD310DRAFT_981972 [Dichomitus squalens]|uniref:Uncharacterized protein n=1 Tax=Dichomitus squalens TaxID=114155 RepID=A0A4Q9PHE4_9APHY|nr:hypothetical protein BD310DRAFT_981972 [Dichomitus squalens]